MAREWPATRGGFGFNEPDAVTILHRAFGGGMVMVMRRLASVTDHTVPESNRRDGKSKNNHGEQYFPHSSEYGPSSYWKVKGTIAEFRRPEPANSIDTG